MRRRSAVRASHGTDIASTLKIAGKSVWSLQTKSVEIEARLFAPNRPRSVPYAAVMSEQLLFDVAGVVAGGGVVVVVVVWWSTAWSGARSASF